MTRRNFIVTAAAASAAPLTAAGNFMDKVGAQLYTVRNQLPTKPRETLEAIAAIGYRDVEVQDTLYPKLKPFLTELKLTASSYRIPTPLVTGNWDAWAEMSKRMPGGPPARQELAAVADLAAKSGFRYMAISFLLPAERETPDQAKRTIESLNRAGEICAKSGLKLCHHNHANEFAPMGDSTLFDLMMSSFDPRYVHLQLDVFWASIAGQDPAALLRRYPNRIPTLHLKDKTPGTANTFAEFSVKPDAFAEIGSGSIDIAAVLRAAEASGVERYYVEQDHSADPVASLKSSYAALGKLASRP